MNLLEICNLDFYLGQSCIIDNFNFSLKKGEIITLFGPSGCGKTTLLKVISKILEPRNGEIVFSGRISYLFQEHRLFESVSIYENIALVMKKENKEWILKELESVGLDKKDSSKYPQELSGGMRARAAFIRALAHKCDLLLLDEPFSGLDFKMREVLIKKVTNLAQNNCAVILVTHDAYEACMLSNKIVFLSKKGMQIEKVICIEEKERSEAFLKDLFKREFKGRMYFD